MIKLGKIIFKNSRSMSSVESKALRSYCKRKYKNLNMCPKVNDIVELNEIQRLIVLNVKRVR